MTCRENGRDPIKYVAMHYWPIISHEIGGDLIVIGRDIIQINRITDNWWRQNYDYIATNQN